MIELLRRRLVLRSGTVMQTYPGLRVGNYLYFALRAFIEQRRGYGFRVLDSGLDSIWVDTLPRLRPLLASPNDARFRRSTHIPPSFCQAAGVDFTVEDLETFVRHIVLASLKLPDRAPDLVVNVRRGDYYSNASFRPLYAFDIIDYVRRAVTEATVHDRPRWLSVVSDDPRWCATNLEWLVDSADHVSFGAAAPGPVADFCEIASSPRLVLTNSTFSYWAGYVSGVRHGAAHRGVWVPDLHQRDVNGGRPWQHLPGWRALDVAP